MNAFAELVDWFSDPAHWHGSAGVPARVVEHLTLSFAAVAAAALIALPIGVYIGHVRRGEFLAVTIANFGRAIPSFAILSIVFQLMLHYFKGLAFGFWPTLVTLFFLAVPPILTNAYVGVQTVDPDTVDAARGMGLSERQVLTRLELPLATAVIVAGLRTATLQVIATATLAALIAGGGLGRFIVDGFAVGEAGTPTVLAGALLVALLAIVTDLAFGVLERAISPRLSSRGRKRLARGFEPGVIREG